MSQSGIYRVLRYLYILYLFVQNFCKIKIPNLFSDAQIFFFSRYHMHYSSFLKAFIFFCLVCLEPFATTLEWNWIWIISHALAFWFIHQVFILRNTLKANSILPFLFCCGHPALFPKSCNCVWLPMQPPPNLQDLSHGFYFLIYI